MAGAIDLFSGSSALSGTNLWQSDKDPLKQLDMGIQDVIGKQSTGIGNSIITGLEAIISGILGIPLGDFTQVGSNLSATGTVTDLFSFFGNLLKFLGDLNPLSPNFSVTNAITDFWNLVAGPSNLFAPLEQLITGVFTIPNLNIPGLDASKITSGQFPQNMIMGLETALGDLATGNIQGAIDAILASVGFAPGTGTTTDLTSYFNDLMSMLGLPSLTSSGFNPITAVENFITSLIQPTGLLAPLEQLLPGIFTVPSINIPGLDASKVTSGQFPQNMIIGLESALSDLASGNIQGAIDAILASVGFAPGTGTTTDLTTYFNDLLSMLGLPSLTSSSFNPVTAVESFITSLIQPTGLLAPLTGGLLNVLNIPGLDATKITSGQFPQNMILGLESALSDLASGNIQGAIDAILASVGFAPGTGTTTDLTSYFNDLLSMLGLPGLTSSGFSPVTAVENFITSLIQPTGLLAPLEQLLPGVFTVPATNIPGMDASKITSGVFPQNMVQSLESDLTALTGGNSTLSTALQTVIDGINAAMGVLTTGNLPGSVETVLKTIPGGNIISTLLASVIPGLDATKITSGIFGTGLIPNLDATKIISGIFNALQIPGLDATKITSGTFPQNMLNITSIASNIVTGVFGAGQIPGLDASKIISGVLGVFSIPNITMPMSTDMTTIVNGVLSAMGLPTGQPASSVQTALTNIPGLNIISTLLGSVIPGLDASKIISGIFGGGLIPNLDASKIVSGVFGALQIPGLDASKVTSGTFAQNMVSGLPTALASMLTGSSPINALNLFNQIPTTLLGMIPYSNVGPTTATNLLSIPGFDNSGSIIDYSGTWVWNATDGHTSLGCAQATANGTLQTLLSNTIGVGQGQQMSIGAWVKYTGLTANAGQNAIRINVAAYLGATLVTTQQVAGIASPSGTTGWVQMSGSWTVPAGVDNIVVQLVVTADALVGTVLFDDASATKTGLMNGNWMSGISGTVAADIQSAVDQIFHASSGGTSTGNPLTSIFGSLTNIPGLNIVSTLLGSVIPGLDASKITTGVMGTTQVPNITLPMSSDLQGLNDYITNTLLGVVGQFVGTGLPQSNASMASLYGNLSNATTTIQALKSQQQSTNNSGTSVSIDFSNYPNGPLPSSFTTTYSGTGTSALGVSGGAAGWSPLNNDGNRTAITVYNVQPTMTDYQIVRGTMASAPGGSVSGGQPRIGAVGRVDSPSNPRNYVWARAYSTGFLSYKADVGCTVNGVDTVFASGISLTWSMDISVVIGSNNNPRRYQAFSGTQLIFDYTESGTTSQFGPGFRYWGAKTEMKQGSSVGNPGTISSTSVSDNAPPAVLGSTFRASRHSTSTVSYANSSSAAAKLPAGFWDTEDWISPDMTWDGNNLTINTEGSYAIGLRYNCSNIPSNSKFTPVLFQNTAAQGAGGTNVAAWISGGFADSWTGQADAGVGGTALVYCHAGDIFTPGYASTAAGSVTGDPGGDQSYFTAALMNRSMA